MHKALYIAICCTGATLACIKTGSLRSQGSSFGIFAPDHVMGFPAQNHVLPQPFSPRPARVHQWWCWCGSRDVTFFRGYTIKVRRLFLRQIIQTTKATAMFLLKRATAARDSSTASSARVIGDLGVDSMPPEVWWCVFTALSERDRWALASSGPYWWHIFRELVKPHATLVRRYTFETSGVHAEQLSRVEGIQPVFVQRHAKLSRQYRADARVQFYMSKPLHGDPVLDDYTWPIFWPLTNDSTQPDGAIRWSSCGALARSLQSSNELSKIVQAQALLQKLTTMNPDNMQHKFPAWDDDNPLPLRFVCCFLKSKLHISVVVYRGAFDGICEMRDKGLHLGAIYGDSTIIGQPGEFERYFCDVLHCLAIAETMQYVSRIWSSPLVEHRCNKQSGAMMSMHECESGSEPLEKLLVWVQARESIQTVSYSAPLFACPFDLSNTFGIAFFPGGHLHTLRDFGPRNLQNLAARTMRFHRLERQGYHSVAGSCVEQSFVTRASCLPWVDSINLHARGGVMIRTDEVFVEDVFAQILCGERNQAPCMKSATELRPGSIPWRATLILVPNGNKALQWQDALSVVGVPSSIFTQATGRSGYNDIVKRLSVGSVIIETHDAFANESSMFRATPLFNGPPACRRLIIDSPVGLNRAMQTNQRLSIPQSIYRWVIVDHKHPFSLGARRSLLAASYFLVSNGMPHDVEQFLEENMNMYNVVDRPEHSQLTLLQSQLYKALCENGLVRM